MRQRNFIAWDINGGYWCDTRTSIANALKESIAGSQDEGYGVYKYNQPGTGGRQYYVFEIIDCTTIGDLQVLEGSIVEIFIYNHEYRRGVVIWDKTQYVVELGSGDKLRFDQFFYVTKILGHIVENIEIKEQ
jgi:hypothetical protein